MPREVDRQPKSDERRPPRQERAAAEARAATEPRVATEPTEGRARGKKRAATPKSRLPEHAVFLIPGLLGFERFSTFGYFADRVVAALRSGLEAALKQPVPVVAVPIPPTASLRERQARLIRTLADRLHALEHQYQPLHVHLVGHSTGGVDADLLTYEQPVGGGQWADLDPRGPALRARIRSLVSIASPHQGACIARDPVAQFKSLRDLNGLPALASLIGKFALSTMKDVELGDLLISAYREGGKTYRFLNDVLGRWDLLADLQPSRNAAGSRPKSGVVRRSFVTVAGRPKPGSGAGQPADAFFRELSERASGWNTGSAEEGELVRASIARLSQALAEDRGNGFVIKAAGIELPRELDAGHNDGVVNSARQLMDPSDPDELAGIVVGDHFDVVGYYDRYLWTFDADGHERWTPVVSGLLHSGSGFRDREFFELYQRVALTIASAAGRAPD